MLPSNTLVALVAPLMGLTQAAALHPNSFVTVHLYGEYDKHYVEKVWPDGDEHWFNEGADKWKKEVEIKFIKYYTEKEDSEIRCLPVESYYPWNPLKIKKFFKLPDDHGFKVYGLALEKPQPIEVLRCDLP